MPETHYAVGGSMAVYNAKGRWPTYSIVGDPDSNAYVPAHREGSGAIVGSGSLAVSQFEGAFFAIAGAGAPAAAIATRAHSGTAQIIGAGAPASTNTSVRTITAATVIGKGSLAGDGDADEGRDASVTGAGVVAVAAASVRTQAGTIIGNGSFAAEATSALNFYQMIQAIGATASLDFCLDAADINSYDGSGQTWTDLTGNGNSFYRGSNNTAQASDPTFNGVAGALSEDEYFSFDGGDWFTETTGHTFAEAWHKDNAAFTIVAVIYRVDADDDIKVFRNVASTSAPGTSFNINAGRPHLEISKSASGDALDIELSVDDLPEAIPNNAAFMYAVALNEATGTNGVTIRWNEAEITDTSTYNSPSSTDSTFAYEFGRSGSSHEENSSGARLYCIAGWSRKLTDTELDNLYAQLQNRYSDLP